jgi:prephenate dehydrogenase
MIINIVGGRGPMGITHTPLFEAAGHKVIISGRESVISLEEAARISDVTIVSVPISYTVQMIQSLAPYCHGALMDFTSVKKRPIDAMLKYSNPDCGGSDCEVGGLHPLYKVFSKGKTVVYCPTERSGERCGRVVEALRNAGANIEILDPTEHDRRMAYEQNARIRAAEAYVLAIIESGMTIKEAYAFAPSPTRILLDLAARTVDPINDEMFAAMADYNPSDPYVTQTFSRNLSNLDFRTAPQTIRKYFGDELGPAQERARKLIEG